MNFMNYAEMNLQELEARVKALRSLCHQLDPYSPLEESTIERLKEFNIDSSRDPFTLTNQLLLLMEGALEELQARTSNNSLH